MGFPRAYTKKKKAPSFTGNFFGSVDLNAITPDSSPAYGLQTEHPGGRGYAKTYLDDVVRHYKVDVRTGVTVSDVKKIDTGIAVVTDTGDFHCRFLVWAGGEFQYPKRIPHTARIGASYGDIPVGEHVIIGGSESGIDAAHHLVAAGSDVTVIDPSSPWEQRVSDSSYGLSPYTLDRLEALQSSGRCTFVDERADLITPTHVTTLSHQIPLKHPAIDCTGFDLSVASNRQPP